MITYLSLSLSVCLSLSVSVSVSLSLSLCLSVSLSLSLPTPSCRARYYVISLCHVTSTPGLCTQLSRSVNHRTVLVSGHCRETFKTQRSCFFRFLTILESSPFSIFLFSRVSGQCRNTFKAQGFFLYFFRSLIILRIESSPHFSLVRWRYVSDAHLTGSSDLKGSID